MNRLRKPDRPRGFSPVRVLATTAFVGVVFSVGLIVGQHLLFDDTLPPVVSTSDDGSSSNVAEAAEKPTLDDKDEPNLFSFYEVLTSAEMEADSSEPRHLGSDEAFAAAPDTDPNDEDGTGFDSGGVDPAFGIDDDQPPNTDDGSIPARYTLQIASHPTMEQARTEMDRLRAMELEPHVVAANVPEQGKYYRVRVGKFQDEDQARAFQARLEAGHNLRAIITPL